METIRLMLVDDHEVVRTGLRAFLELQPGLQVVAEAGSGIQALELVEQAQPQVVLMDITMPHMDGLEATRRLKEHCPGCRVLALTVHSDKEYFFEMLSAGADGYVTKMAAAEDLVAAVHAVAQGHVYLQPALAAWLLEDYRRLRWDIVPAAPPGARRRPAPVHPAAETATARTGDAEAAPAPALEALSRREMQVLEGVAQGLTTLQIAEQLGISPKTVMRHRERLMKRLNLHSTTALVKFAIRAGVIEMS